jgi:glycosyltransferase involved in cell wall biosynthesis
VAAHGSKKVDQATPLKIAALLGSLRTRMRILFVNYEYPPLGGGGGVVTRDIAEELARRHEVDVLTSAGLGLAARERCGGVAVHRAPVLGRTERSTASILSMISFWPIGLAHGRQALGGRRYDVVNSWFAVPSGPVGAGLARQHAAPHVVTMAGGDVYDPSKWYTPDKNPVLGLTVRRVLVNADAHVAVSSDLARRARSLHGFRGPIEVIPLGMPAPAVAPASRRELGLDPDALYVATVGRLVRRKNLATLIAALARLRRDDVHLLVIGDGPECPRLMAQAEACGLAARVQFRGFVPDETKYQLLAAADLFALASLHEAFGLVYLEAMHCGLPVIAARPGGQEDYLEEGRTGFLVPPGDLESLVRALVVLVGDGALRARMREHNRALAHRFTIRRTAARYESLFARLACAPSAVLAPA